MSSNNPPQCLYNEFIAYIRRVCEYIMTIYHCDAHLPKFLPRVHLVPNSQIWDKDIQTWVPSTDCGDTDGGIAFEIDFRAYPNFTLLFTTDSICEILYNYGEELPDGAKHEILCRINRAFLQHIYNEANRN